MSGPYRCPVCSGRGIVPAGWYTTTTGTWVSNGVGVEDCRTCTGTGIVWPATDPVEPT